MCCLHLLLLVKPNFLTCIIGLSVTINMKHKIKFDLLFFIDKHLTTQFIYPGLKTGQNVSKKIEFKQAFAVFFSSWKLPLWGMLWWGSLHVTWWMLGVSPWNVLKTVDFELFWLSQSSLCQPLTDIFTLISLQLQYLTILWVLNHSSVASKFLTMKM